MGIVIIPDSAKKEAELLAVEISSWLNKRPCSAGSKFAILLGGDGFIMRKSRELAQDGTPFVAVNFGKKGFLAAAEKDNWQDVLAKVITGRFQVERRPILEVRHLSGGRDRKYEAAGNVYIRHRADMILVSVSIDRKSVYKKLPCDGMIVANATGATAYNLGAKGAIITSGLVITPICPHSLNVISLPVPPSAKKIKMIYHGRQSSFEEDEGCLLRVDSEKYLIEPGDELEIRKSEKDTSFVIPEGFSFVESLQKKLGLST